LCDIFLLVYSKRQWHFLEHEQLGGGAGFWMTRPVAGRDKVCQICRPDENLGRDVRSLFFFFLSVVFGIVGEE